MIFDLSSWLQYFNSYGVIYISNLLVYHTLSPTGYGFFYIYLSTILQALRAIVANTIAYCLLPIACKYRVAV